MSNINLKSANPSSRELVDAIRILERQLDDLKAQVSSNVVAEQGQETSTPAPGPTLQPFSYRYDWLVAIPTEFNPTDHDASKVVSGVFPYARLPISAADVTSWNQAYADTITGLSGDGNSTLTLARITSADLTVDLSHTHLIDEITNLWPTLDSKIPYGEKAVADGVATLDSNAKLPLVQIPDSIIGQVEYMGTWNANTNTPTLPLTPTEKGHYYVVNTAGTFDGKDFQVGDWIISDGSAWDKVDNTDAVQSVAGRTGAVTLTAADIGGLADIATSGSYTDLSDVPSTFPPSTHTHAIADINDYDLTALHISRITAASASDISHSLSTTTLPGIRGFRTGSGLLTYEQALNEAAALGARLPTLWELENGITAGSGYGYDSDVTWTCTSAGPGRVYGNFGSGSGTRVILDTSVDTAVGGFVVSVEGLNSYLDTVYSESDTTYSAGDGLTLSGTTFSVDSTVVRTSGNQIIEGQKTFSVGIPFQSISGDQDVGSNWGDGFRFQEVSSPAGHVTASFKVSSIRGFQLRSNSYGEVGSLSFRTVHSNFTDGLSPWYTIWNSSNDGQGSGLDADLLDGFHANSSANANTVALRNGSGDIYARLFRSTYQNQGTIATGSAIPFRVSTSDNYIRFCSDMVVVRAHIGAAASSHNHNASDINAGTLADARLSSNVALRSSENNWGTKQNLADDFRQGNFYEQITAGYSSTESPTGPVHICTINLGSSSRNLCLVGKSVFYSSAIFGIFKYTIVIRTNSYPSADIKFSYETEDYGQLNENAYVSVQFNSSNGDVYVGCYLGNHNPTIFGVSSLLQVYQRGNYNAVTPINSYAIRPSATTIGPPRVKYNDHTVPSSSWLSSGSKIYYQRNGRFVTLDIALNISGASGDDIFISGFVPSDIEPVDPVQTLAYNATENADSGNIFCKITISSTGSATLIRSSALPGLYRGSVTYLVDNFIGS